MVSPLPFYTLHHIRVGSIYGDQADNIRADASYNIPKKIFHSDVMDKSFLRTDRGHGLIPISIRPLWGLLHDDICLMLPSEKTFF